MLKKLFISLLIALSIAGNLFAFSFDLPASDGCNTTTQIVDVSMINDAENVSYKLLETSNALLRLSESINANASAANSEYIQAMLQLSTDIGTMADRIGEMADRIVTTEEQIGYMADRIVTTQEIQNNNVSLTQANIMKTQQNLLSALGQ